MSWKLDLLPTFGSSVLMVLPVGVTDKAPIAFE